MQKIHVARLKSVMREVGEHRCRVLSHGGMQKIHAARLESAMREVGEHRCRVLSHGGMQKIHAARLESAMQEVGEHRCRVLSHGRTEKTYVASRAPESSSAACRRIPENAAHVTSRNGCRAAGRSHGTGSFRRRTNAGLRRCSICCLD